MLGRCGCRKNGWGQCLRRRTGSIAQEGDQRQEEFEGMVKIALIRTGGIGEGPCRSLMRR